MNWEAKERGIDLDALKRESHGIDDDYIGVAVAASLYNVSTQTIYRYIKDGQLIVTKTAGRLWLSEAELRRVFAERKAQGRVKKPRTASEMTFTDRQLEIARKSLGV